MSIDLDAIRKKLAQLSGKGGRALLWKPNEGEYTVRLISIPNSDGMPFIERWFYYDLCGQTLLAPFQFDKPDPIKELISECYASNDRDTARSLSPKRRTFAAIVVRGEEDKRVQLWGFSAKTYQQLLSIFMDSDYGDITDPEHGYDLKVTIVKPPGQKFVQVGSIIPKQKQSKLSNNPKQIEEWSSNIPSIDDVYELKSYDQIAKLLNDWLGTRSGDGGDDHVTNATADIASSDRAKQGATSDQVTSVPTTPTVTDKQRQPAKRNGSAADSAPKVPDDQSVDDALDIAFADLI